MAQKKKIKRLKAKDAMGRLDQMIGLIAVDVHVGLGVEAALETANEMATGPLRNIPFYGADCYSAVRQSMALFLAITLAKLFETPSLRGQSKGSRFNESDVASIPLLIRLLKQGRCRKRLSNRARLWKPTNVPDIHARSCERAIDKAVNAYAALRRKRSAREAIAKLKKFRDKMLAHSLLGPALQERPKYRELFLLMDAAREVTEHAQLAIEGIHLDLADVENKLTKMSRAFWEPAMTAAVEANR